MAANGPDNPDNDHGSAWGAAARAIQGFILDELATGTLLLGLVLMAYAAVETRGPVLVAGLLVGTASVVVPLISWHRRWSDRASWLGMIPLLVSILAVFAWAGA